MSAAPIKLKAEDADDVPPISALLQDAVLTRADMAFLPKTRRFAMVLNRFRWEAAAKGRAARTGERVRAGLHVDHVLKAEAQGMAGLGKDAVLSLLALIFAPDSEGGGKLTLTFAGGKSVRLTVEALDLELSDLTAAWVARGRPSHEA